MIMNAFQKDNPFYKTLNGYSDKSWKIILDRALGLCYGSAIGDSIGSFFPVSEGVTNKLEEAMSMKTPGMRYKRAIPGQGTDDTETAMCIARGLLRMIARNADKDKQHHVTMKFVAEEYNTWWQTDPLDQGSTFFAHAVRDKGLNKMRENAYLKNEEIKEEHGEPKGVLTNGSLIRCMPLIVYGIRLQPEQTFNLMRLDSSLTHASYTVYYTVTVYALAAQYLIRYPQQGERNKNAIKFAMEFLSAQKQERKRSKTHNPAIEEVLRWIERAKSAADDKSTYAPQKLDEFREFHSHIKISFQRAFYHLWKGDSYDVAIKETLIFGGNADSNCCVVGGLIGAYHGMKPLVEKREIIDNWPGNSDNHENTDQEKRDPYQAKWYRQYVPLLLNYALPPKGYHLSDKTATYDPKSKEEEFVL
ncbi:ADP-ribosylation/Crystallin J1 [Reticulomyxa filosa]|uniref:ADP-ribosylhydrolase ARH3 n=1 Tax=Reticulomyxa filosa TaxID=46433 RepID=X6NK26_RETFI|nr:ADP-ribosylation/Crystallin J1 [Reticulomyxa filosa]|eukprot:ETO25712.1 ADP-ribosylation/Crystallin J1 [Reticulomyxa filosa]